MGESTIKFGDDTACRKCAAIVPLTREHESCAACGNELYRLTAPQFYSEVERGRIVDVRHGGLVIGRSGREDDIPMFQSEGNGVYSLVGFMHGGEYILSGAATKLYFDRLEQINSEKGANGYGEFQFEMSKSTTVINVDVVADILGLWVDIDGQFIINSFATTKHFAEIEEINRKAAVV